jgi:hypothetical protein
MACAAGGSRRGEFDAAALVQPASFRHVAGTLVGTGGQDRRSRWTVLGRGTLTVHYSLPGGRPGAWKAASWVRSGPQFTDIGEGSFMLFTSFAEAPARGASVGPPPFDAWHTSRLAPGVCVRGRSDSH